MVGMKLAAILKHFTLLQKVMVDYETTLLQTLHVEVEI